MCYNSVCRWLRVRKRLTDENAVVAELAYAHDSGSCPRKWVRVQVPSTALNVRAKNVEKSMFLALFSLSKIEKVAKMCHACRQKFIISGGRTSNVVL